MVMTFVMQHVITAWLLTSLMLLFIELATPGLFFFVSFSFGSLFGALVAFLGYPFPVQCAVVLIVSIVQFTSMRRRLRRFNREKRHESNVHALVGKQGVVTRAIGEHEAGLVKLGGETWSATCTEQGVIKKGAKVQVMRIEGNRVVVRTVFPDADPGSTTA